MGLGAYEELLESLRSSVPEAFWPRIERLPDGSIKLLWPKVVHDVSQCVEDMCGTMRGWPLTTVYSPAATVDVDREIGPDELVPIACPADLAETIAKKFSREFAQQRTRLLHVVWDAIGGTPIIKGILAEKRQLRPVEFPHPPDTLFTSNAPFRNDIHEIFSDKQFEGLAKRLLYDYICNSLLDFYPSKILEPGTRMIVWGGFYHGKPMKLPVSIEMSTEGVLSEPTELSIWPGFSDMPYHEADLTIIALVHSALGHGHVKVNSRDNDFIPALCSVYIDKLKAFMASRKTAPDPRAYSVLISRKVEAKGRMVVPLNGSSGSSDSSASGTPAVPRTIPSLFKKPNGANTSKLSENNTGTPIKTKVRELLDVGALAAKMWIAFSKGHRNCKLCDPMAAFAAVCYGSGSDYYRKAPYLSFRQLCATYLDPDCNRKIGCIFRVDASATPRRVRVDRKAYIRWLALAYVRSRNLKPADVPDPCNLTLIRAHLNDVKEKNAAKKKPTASDKPARTVDNLPPQHPDHYAARLAWVLSYYLKSHQPGWVHYNGLEEEVVEGKVVSVFGYAKDKNTGKPDLAENLGVPVKAIDIY